jgi:hypothetical protein
MEREAVSIIPPKYFGCEMCCVPVYGVPTNYDSKTEYLFFVFQSIIRANTANNVNMNANLPDLNPYDPTAPILDTSEGYNAGLLLFHATTSLQ